jgi:hypothetical protein
MQRNATQRKATQRNATQCNATQRNATQSNDEPTTNQQRTNATQLKLPHNPVNPTTNQFLIIWKNSLKGDGSSWNNYQVTVTATQS